MLNTLPLLVHTATESRDYRRISSWLGDHQRMPVILCFCFLLSDGLLEGLIEQHYVRPQHLILGFSFSF